MERVSISQLKNSLSAFIKKVRAGQTFVVFDRDEPVARLERVQPSSMDDRIAALERAGLVRRPTKSVPADLLHGPPPRSSRSVLEGLLEERREGR